MKLAIVIGLVSLVLAVKITEKHMLETDTLLDVTGGLSEPTSDITTYIARNANVSMINSTAAFK